MDDDLRVVDAPMAEAVVDAPADPFVDGPGAHGRRRWPRRVGVAILALLLLGLSGLQIQAARVQAQTEEAEVLQRAAELDEDAARIRLESVGDRVRDARAQEGAAQAELGRARTDMAAEGLEESALSSVQASTADEVRGLRAGVKKVANDIAEQNRLQPAAAACLFDMLRALGRVDTGARGGQASEACKTVASSPGPG